MASLNTVMLLGRLGRDPELRSKAGKSPVATLSVATDRIWKDRTSGERRQETDWHRVVAFGSEAENCAKYLGKGSLVYVEGRLTTQSWEDRDGNKRFITKVCARRVQFLDRRAPSPGGAPPGGPTSVASGGPQAVPDDDIPF